MFLNQSSEELLTNIKGIDYIEFYVGNAFQTAYFYQTGFGFTPVAYRGLETGSNHQISWVLKQQNINLVFTSSLDNNSDIARHVSEHGDGVKDIALRVSNVEKTFEILTKIGAAPILEPTREEDDQGKLIKATIGGFGDTVHSLIERENYQGIFAPNYQVIPNYSQSKSIGITDIDHIAICVESGKLDRTCDFYREIFGFAHIFEMDRVLGENGMNLKAMQNNIGTITLTICEPVSQSCKSPISEYITHYGGSGVQHLAFSTNDMIKTAQALRKNQIQFLTYPDTYYEMLKERIGEINEDINSLHQLKILADRDQEGYLLQAFTKIIQDRPTFFLEIIQRHGSSSFGLGNIRIGFEAAKQEQKKRNNF